jgi:hypothetical protein
MSELNPSEPIQDIKDLSGTDAPVASLLPGVDEAFVGAPLNNEAETVESDQEEEPPAPWRAPIQSRSENESDFQKFFRSRFQQATTRTGRRRDLLYGVDIDKAIELANVMPIDMMIFFYEIIMFLAFFFPRTSLVPALILLATRFYQNATQILNDTTKMSNEQRLRVYGTTSFHFILMTYYVLHILGGVA